MGCAYVRESEHESKSKRELSVDAIGAMSTLAV